MSTTTLSPESVQRDVAGIIAKELEMSPEVIRPELTLAKLGADSLDVAQIFVEIEEQFGIEPDTLFGQAERDNRAAGQDSKGLSLTVQQIVDCVLANSA